MSDIRTRISPTSGLEEVFDPQRHKWVRLTPEERVRQQFVKFLIEQRNFPQGRIGNEVPITVGRVNKRCDTVVYDQEGKPLVICEYKASSVPITQKVFNQILRYDLALQVSYLIVSNGIRHYCCRLNRELNRFDFLPDIPDYSELRN